MEVPRGVVANEPDSDWQAFRKRVEGRAQSNTGNRAQTDADSTLVVDRLNMLELIAVVPYIPFDIAKIVIATLVVSLLPNKYTH